MFRGILNQTKDLEQQHLPYLAFIMRDIYTRNFMDTLTVLVFVFHEGTIQYMIWINAANNRSPTFLEYTYNQTSHDNFVNMFKAIINGTIFDVGSDKKLILLKKPWMKEAAKLYGRDWALSIPFGATF